MPEDVDVLDRLLKKLASDPTVQNLEDRAHDSGHLTDEVLASFREGALDGEEQRNIRRHILFCDLCSALVLNRGGEVDDEPAAAPDPATPRDEPSPEEPSPAPSSSLERLRAKPWFRLLVGVAAVTVGLAAALWIFSGLGRDSDSRPGTVLEVRAGAFAPGGTILDGAMTADDAIALQLRGSVDGPVHIYVLAILPAGDWQLLHPAAGEVSAARPIAETVRLPAAERGWKPGEPRAGDDLAVVVLVSRSRIAALEGDMVSETTLPRWEAEMAPRGTRFQISELTLIERKLRAMQLADLVRLIVIKVR